MKKRILFIANWKMNLSASQTHELLISIMPVARKYAIRVATVIAPSFPFLRDCMYSMKYTQKPLELCAQDCFWEQSGAYTGEVSPDMLADSGCTYVLIGHSERRMYLRETDSMIHKKLICIVTAKKSITPVLCIGETAQQRKARKSTAVLKIQLNAALKGMVLKRNQRLIIAYEPIWAIGSGIPMTADAFGICVKDIRAIVKTLLGDEAFRRCQIVYGGSVTPQSAASYVSVGGDGVLVGGASQHRDSCRELIRQIAKR